MLSTMRFLSNLRLGTLLSGLSAALALGGCASGPGGVEPPPAETPTPGTSVAFEAEGTLTLALGEVTTLSVRVAPAATSKVHFGLVGESLDASLAATTVLTDESGAATIELTAPSGATAFRVRATLDGGGSAELAVSVSDEGFVSLRAVPKYEGGRAVDVWTAAVVPRSTCADLAALLPSDPEGALLATSEAPTVPIVHDVPIGPSLAVIVRWGEASLGCTDATASALSEQTSVVVPVLDRPVDLTETALGLSFGLEGNALDLGLALDRAALLDAFAPAGVSSSELVLQAMAAQLAPADAAAFEGARSLGAWDQASEAVVPELRAAVDAFFDAGLALADDGIEASLLPTETPGASFVELHGVLGLSPADASMPSIVLASFSADSKDVAYLGAKVHVSSPHLVAAFARAGAAELTGASDMREALADAAACAELSLALGGFAGCDAACLEALCADALEARWLDARDALSLELGLGTLDLTASGPMGVSALALPSAWSGSWVATLLTQGDATLSGPVVGAPIETPPP